MHYGIICLFYSTERQPFEHDFLVASADNKGKMLKTVRDAIANNAVLKALLHD